MAKGMHPNSIKAIQPTQWKKGKKPTGGRPKGALSLKERMQHFLDLDVKIKMPDGSIQDKTVLDNILMALMAQAAKGNVKAIQEVLDRHYGKETQKVEVTGKDGQPLEIEHSSRLQTVYERAANAFQGGSGLLSAGSVANGSILLDDSGSKS